MTYGSSHMSWPIVPLGSVARVVGGSTPDSGNTSYWGGDIVWVTPADLGQLETIHVRDSGRRITRLGFLSTSIDMLPVNSVILSSRAPIGYLAINDVPLCTNQGCKSFVPGASLDTRYLFYFLKRAVPALRELGSGATFAEVSKSKLENYPIPVPPLPEQQRIVAKLDEQMAALDRADMALAAQQAVARAFKRATLQTTLDQATHPEWKCTTLGELCTFANGLWTGKKPPFQQASVIRNTNFTSDCTLDFSDIAHLDVEERQLRSRRLRAGDIILERSGGGPKQPVGRVALFELDDESYSFSNFTSVIRVNERNRVLPRFLWYYLFHLHNSGATEALQNHTSGIRNLDFSSYVLLSIPVPTLDEQRRIVDHLDRSIEQTNNLLSYVAGQTLTLVSLRNSFLEAAFSGEV